MKWLREMKGRQGDGQERDSTRDGSEQTLGWYLVSLRLLLQVIVPD